MSPPAKHARWGADALWQALEPLLPGIAVEVLPRVESTNTELLERCRLRGRAGDASVPPRGRRSDDTRPCLLVAEVQTRGRGRQGRDWLASEGASLTFSLLLPMSPADWSGLSLAVGCALADALEAPGAPTPRIGLKWPNDLWLLDATAAGGVGRKLGGILIETVNVGAQRMVVVGVGLNVHAQPGTDGLAHGFASLDEIDPALDAPAALARVARPLALALRRFETQGFAPFRHAWAPRDLLEGRPLVTQGSEPVAGTGEGVDPGGALRLLTGGEVSVRLAPAAG
jgi:BirA family biotin operon repressor/biotin-[acetyl-CoA-carboxylase] ligase